MKRAELVFNLIAIPLDAAMVLASAVFAYFLRIKFAAVWPIIFDIRTVDYLSTIAFILPFLLGLFALYGLYNMRSTDSLGLELSRILAAVTTALMLVVLIFFFNRDVFPSRLIVLMSWITTLLFVSWGRVLLRFIRGAVAGALATMGVVMASIPETWGDLVVWFEADLDDVAKHFLSTFRVVRNFSEQPLFQKLVIELYERRMLDDS